MVKVVVVILNFNRWENTVECLDSLRKIEINKNTKLEIVIVDNASKDDSVKEIKNKYPKITLLENKINKGFTGGCNTGAEYALENGADYVMFLNNDTIVDQGLLSTLVETAGEQSVGGVLPKIYFYRGHEFHKERYQKKDLGKVIWYAGGEMDWDNLIGKNIGVDEVDCGQFETKREVGLATGCCFLVKREVLDKIGLFDEKFFLYYEDADLSERVKKAGYKIMYEPKAFMWHKNAVSSGGSGSVLQDYYITRNRLLFGMRYGPLRTKLALIRESLRILKNGREWQKRGVIDFYKRHFGRGSFSI